MIWPTVMRGSSELYGSWKIICSLRRRARNCGAAQLCDVLAVQPDAAGGGIDQPGDGAAKSGFAAAAFAHQAEGFARREAKAHVVHRLDKSLLDGEMNFEVSHLQQRLTGCAVHWFQ